MKILAIDPGINGGACIYAPSCSVASGLRWQVIDLPTTGEGSQRRIDARALSDWIRSFAPDCGFVELAGTMPEQGVAGVFRYGRAVGAIDALVECFVGRVFYITPQRWKKHFGLRNDGAAQHLVKEKSRLLALRLAPELESDLCRKKDHGRAEAVLLALYGAAKVL